MHNRDKRSVDHGKIKKKKINKPYEIIHFESETKN